MTEPSHRAGERRREEKTVDETPRVPSARYAVGFRQVAPRRQSFGELGARRVEPARDAAPQERRAEHAGPELVRDGDR